MEMVIVTGMSGAGKSWAIDVFEDIGYYCIDNMPPFLIPKFAELSAQSDGVVSKIAMVVDIRGGSHFNSFIDVLDELDAIAVGYKILFLDASDAELVRRYKETRRKHPLLDECGSVQKAIGKEREMLKGKIGYLLILNIVTDKQGNAQEITFKFRNNDPVMTKFDPDRLYQLEQNLKKILKLNPSKADSSIKNMKYIQAISYKDLK